MPLDGRTREYALRTAAYIGGVLGLALLLTLAIRSDLEAILQTLGLAGWRLLWLVPYRALYFLLYATGWRVLLHAYDPLRLARLAYLFWVTTVREAIDRLLPVASIGGAFAGVRLVRWRGLAAPAVGATVVVEILLTLAMSYLFAVVGVLLLTQRRVMDANDHQVLVALVLSLPAPIATALALRYGSVFARLAGFVRPLVGESALSTGAAALDHEVKACLRRIPPLLGTGALQLAALMSAAAEIWFVLRLFGHPISACDALILESMTQAVRHAAFVIPAGLGVQEAGLVIFGHALGISNELALAVSMAKRMREVLCGVPSLLSWQWFEARRVRTLLRNPS